MRRFTSIAVPLFLLWVACAKEPAVPEEVDTPFVVRLPLGLADPPVPAQNQLTQARVALGKELFFDERLSLGNGVSCASCHHTDRAFSDTVVLSTGAGGEFGLRNAPTLANVAWQTALFADGGVPTLEQQVLAPMHDAHEMGSDINAAAEQLRGIEPYASLSLRAYDRGLDGFVITRALASYERTLVSGWSRFDRLLYGGDAAALTEEEEHGWSLFNSAGCVTCHSGHDLTDHSYRNIGSDADLDNDPGRQRITLDPGDRGRFKVPTLRNIALTAPYLHDGSMTTLEEVIAHFDSGGGDDPNKDPGMVALSLSAQDRSDLKAFLLSLTDDRSLDQVP